MSKAGNILSKEYNRTTMFKNELANFNSQIRAKLCTTQSLERNIRKTMGKRGCLAETKKGEGKEGEEESNINKNAESKTEENISSNAKSTGAPEQQQQVGKTPKKPAIKVRQPPGGASSGLW